MMRPLRDPLRTELVYLARDARSLTGYAREEMTTTALGFVELSAVSAPLWNEAVDNFDSLVIAIDVWDHLAEHDEPWERFIVPEEHVRAVSWNDARWSLCRTINIHIDRLIACGIFSHLPCWTVRVEGAVTVVTEVGP